MLWAYDWYTAHCMTAAMAQSVKGVRLASGRLGVRIPAATDLSRKKVVKAQTLGNRRECQGSSEMIIINDCPAREMWYAKELSLLIGHECRA